jgi:hypothetical protein
MDLFGDEAETQQTGPIVGLVVDLQDACACGTNLAVIGAGSGPHLASLRCQACDHHRGWVSRQSYNFLTKTTEQFGRTDEPIKVRRAA